MRYITIPFPAEITYANRIHPFICIQYIGGPPSEKSVDSTHVHTLRQIFFPNLLEKYQQIKMIKIQILNSTALSILPRGMLSFNQSPLPPLTDVSHIGLPGFQDDYCQEEIVQTIAESFTSLSLWHSYFKTFRLCVQNLKYVLASFGDFCRNRVSLSLLTTTYGEQPLLLIEKSTFIDFHVLNLSLLFIDIKLEMGIEIEFLSHLLDNRKYRIFETKAKKVYTGRYLHFNSHEYITLNQRYLITQSLPGLIHYLMFISRYSVSDASKCKSPRSLSLLMPIALETKAENEGSKDAGQLSLTE